MDFLNFANIVQLPKVVTDWLGGPFSLLVGFALNAMAIAIILLVAFRLAMIGIQSIMSFRDAQGSGSEIVSGAIRAMAATVLAGAVGFLLAAKGIPFLLEFSQSANSTILTDPGIKTDAIDRFFKGLPFLGVIFHAISTLASLGAIMIGGILLVKTGIDALQQTKYTPGGSGGQFAPLQDALKRAGFIMVLTIIAYVAVSSGPQLLFGYLDSLSGQLSGPVIGP